MSIDGIIDYDFRTIIILGTREGHYCLLQHNYIYDYNDEHETAE